MRRVYTSVAHFRAPYDTPNISFAGLGVLGAPGHVAYDANKWAAGRTYFDVSQYRAPLRSGYFQSGALRGDDSGTSTTAMVLIGLFIAGSIAFGVLGDLNSKKA